MGKLFAWIFLGLASLTACSSGSGAGSGAGGSIEAVSCETYCDKGLALSCATKTREQCLAACESDSTERGECAGAYRAAGACLIDKLGCDLATSSASDAILACPEENAAYGSCIACTPDVDDDACDACSKQNCCTERKNAYSDVEVVKASACYGDCVNNGGPDCEALCLAQHPAANAKIDAIESCTSKACPGC